METITKNTILYFLWFVILIAIVIVFWLFFSRKIIAKSPSSALPPPDTVTTQDLTQGNRLITNITARYEMIVPSAWYLEKKFGSGITVYPNYDPMKNSLPACKIEISLLKNSQSVDLDDWLTDYLHEDPTVDIIESS